MEKQLLSFLFIFSLFFLNPVEGFGQCPTSVSISANPGTTICAGTSVSFTANASGGVSSVFQWQVNGNVVGTNSSTYSTTSLTNGAKVKVIVTSSPESSCNISSNELTMTVNPVVTPTVSIGPTKTSICPGESITFNATNTFGGTSPQYAWYINSGNTVAKTGASATFSSSDFTEGNNTVRVVLTSNIDCASSPTAQATSAPFVLKPDATISTPANNNPTICINTPLQAISFGLAGGATNATVSGLPPGVTGTLSGGNYVIGGSPTTRGTFAYTVTTTGSCAQISATGTITVNPNATIALTSGNNTQTVCAAGGVATGNISPITYSIGETGTGATVTGLPSGISGSFSNGVFTIQGSSSVAGTHSYTINATGSCADSAPLTGSIIITANKVLSVSIVSSDADNTICAGASVTFTATPTNGGSAPTYQWKINGVNAGTNNPKFTTSTLTDGQVVTVEMSSSETCLTSAIVSSNAITTTVNPNLTPEVTIVTSDSDICPGDSVTFTATPVNGGTNPIYQWRVGNNNVSTNSSTFTTTSLTNGQNVSVVLTSNETCLATATATSNAIFTTVRQPVPATPGNITGPQQVCATATGLVYSVPAVTNAESYNWTLPTGWSITGEKNTRSITVTASSPGGNISVAAANSCGTSTLSNLAVTTVNGVPSTPGTITSSLPPTNKNICPPLDNLTFSVGQVSGADSYKWTLPSPGWEIVSGAGTNSITVRVTSATTNGTKDIKVEAVNICGNSTQSIYSGIEVNTHIIANIGEDQTVCKSVNSITLNGTRSFGNANLTTNLISSGTGTFTNGPSGNNQNGPFTVTYLPTPADKTAGQVTITLRVPQPTGNNNSGNQCGSGVDEMIIFFRPDATLTNPTNKSQAICINSALDPIIYTLGGTFSGANVTGLPAGITGNFTNGTFTISGTPSVAGTFNYSVNTTGDCTQTSATGTITVDPITTVTAGQAATDLVCQAATPSAITLTGATFGGGATSAAWSITSGSGTLSSTAQTATPQNITYTPAANYTGDVILTLTTNAPGKCTEISATRTISVQPAPTVVAGTAATDVVCQSQSPSPITLTGASFGGGASSTAWSIISGGGTLSSTALTTSPQTVTYTPAPGYTGPVVLSLISDAPGKCSAVSEIRTITVEPAAAVEAGEATTDVVCQSANPSSIILTGASFSGGATTAAWTITSGGGSLSSTDQTATPQNITYTPAINYTGEVILTLTTNAPGTCTAVSDTRTITVEPAAIVEAGGTEAGEEGACQSATPGAITLSGASLSGGAITAAWSITNGGGILSSTAPTSQPELVTYTPIANFTGTVTLTLTSTPVGNCAAVSNTRVIRISEALTLDAGPDKDLCSGYVLTLSDITLGGGVTSAKWEIVTGQGTLSSTAETANPGTVTFTAPTNFKGETVLRLTSNNPEGICDEIYDERTINIQQQVTITTPPVNLGICSTQNATFEVVASGDNLSYQWLFEGAPIANATDAKFVLTRATSANAGSYTVRITGENSCGEPVVSEPVTLNVDEDIIIETPPAGGSYCVGSTIELAIVAKAGGAELTYEWFNSNNLSVGTGATLNLPAETSLSGDYYAIVTGPAGFTCSTAKSNTVTIVVNPIPVINNIGPEIEICSVGAAVDITEGVVVSNESEIEWSVPTGMGTISNPKSLTTATYAPDGATGTVILTLTVKGLDGCSEITATKNITIIPQPVITEFSYITGNNSAVSGEFCETDNSSYTPQVTGDNLNGGTGVYSVDKPALSINNSTGAFTPVGTPPGVYIVTYSFTVNSTTAGCEVATKTFTITIGEKPVAEFTYGANPFCSDSSNISPSFLNGGVAGTFTSTQGLVFIDASTGEINIAASTSGTYEVTNTVDNSEDGCAIVAHSASITINKKPEANFSYSTADFCSDPAVEETISPVMGTQAVKGVFSYTATPAGAVLALNTSSGDIDIKASNAGVYIITNTVNVDGDGCDVVTNNFTITINKKSNATFAYSGGPSFCISSGSAIVETGYETGGTFTSATLGTRLNATTGTITWTATDAITGNHDITYTIQGKGVCTNVTSTVQIKIDPLPVAGKLAFTDIVSSTNDGRIFTICQGATSGYLPITLTGQTGNIVAWKYSVNGAAWVTIAGETGNVLSASKIQSLNLTQTTVFRVEIGSGSCTPNAFSQTAILSVIPTDIKPTPVTVSEPIVCLGEEVTLSSETGYNQGIPSVDGGSFDNAGLKNNGWRFRFNGNDANFETNANNTNPDFWSRATPRNFPTANVVGTSNPTTPQLWDPAVEDGNKGFAIVSGIQQATMETNIFSIGSMDQAVLTFDQAYNLTTGAKIIVEISRDGGATYEKILFSRTGNGILDNSSSGNYGTFGTGTPTTRPKNKMVIDLGDYLGQSNLRIRFSYEGKRIGDIWAVDAIEVPQGPRNVTIEWNDFTNPNSPILIGTTNSVKYIPTKIGLNVFEVKTKLIFDSTGNACPIEENAENIEVFVFDKYTTSVTAEYGSCGVFEVQLTGKIVNSAGVEISTIQGGEIVPTPDGYIGEWVVTGAELVDPNPSDNIPANNDPSAKLITTSAGTFTVSWNLVPTARNASGQLYVNPTACPPVITPIEIIIKECIALDFDGVNDYVDLGNDYTGSYSLEAWILPKVVGGTIISGPGFNVATPAGVSTTKWTHVAVSGGSLYLDGVLQTGVTISGNGGSKTLIGALWTVDGPTEFFKGWIEEVRIWNGTISVENIRFTMNQRLKSTDNIGVEVDMVHPHSPSYANLAGYYQLLATAADILPGGLTADLANIKVHGKLMNMETLQQNTAPLPYYTGDNGSWDTAATWAEPVVWKIPNTNGVDWNIVRTSHNVDANRDITVLGLISKVNTLDMLGINPTTSTGGGTGNALSISHYLRLDGIIDLNGESQLLQPPLSIVDNASSGYLDRDQQGKKNSFVYNYWSSPVSTQGSTIGNYTIKDVLKDGTSLNIAPDITFRPEYWAADAGSVNPLIVSAYWLFTYVPNPANQYSLWKHIGETGSLSPGEGFTMKGTAGNVGIDARQNYTFRGKPNNGEITLASLAPGENYLIGNPYPSAIDAHRFIDDNDILINGTIYFWDHFKIVDHILLHYVGGYATMTKLDAVPAAAIDDRINNDTDSGGNFFKSNTLPKRFIPVGQGFMINSTGSPATGNIKFKNSQREFIPESVSASIFLRPEKEVKEDKNKSTEYQKIRISFWSPVGYRRQILVGAVPGTTDGFDLGYDANLFDDNVEDMYWVQGNNKLVIQSVNDFNKDRVLPLGVKIKENKEFTIKIDTVENADKNLKIYLRDKLKDSIHDIRKGPYVSKSEPGTFNNRFEIIFHKDEPVPPVVVLPTEPDEIFEEFGILIRHGRTDRELQILNPHELGISNMYIFDLRGNKLEGHTGLPAGKEFRMPVANYSSGVYIVQLVVEGRVVSKKIIINN